MVDFPGGLPNSRHCSVSSSGGHQSSGGRSSVSGHTPSSGSSLPRYSSLTTPFYQAPPRQAYQPTTKGNSGIDSTMSIGGRRLEAPTTATTTTTTATATGYYGTSRRSSFGSAPGLMGPSPPSVVPFGKLIQVQHQPSLPGNSPMSQVSSNSYSFGSYSKPLSSSPLSTPSPSPSSLSSPCTGAGGGISNQVGGGAVFKHPLSSRNSGAKLSSLAEERESEKRNNPSTCKTSSGGFDIITRSCLLNSDDEEIDDDTLEDFALGLNMSLTSSYEDAELKSPQHQVPHKTRDIHATMESSQGGVLRFTGYDAVQYAPVSHHHHPRPVSAKGTKINSTSGNRASVAPRRAASFSHKKNPRLSHDLNAINTKATRLTPDHLNSDPLTTPTLNYSPSSEIVAFDVPFLFSTSSSTRTENSDSSSSIKKSLNKANDPSPSSFEKEEAFEDANIGSLKWSDMRDSLILVEEMRAMARARQGPILLMSISTDLVRKGANDIISNDIISNDIMSDEIVFLD